MSARRVRFLDREHRVVATGDVSEVDSHFEGAIQLDGTPDAVLALFDEFEEIVDGQMLSFLDEIQERIGQLSISAAFGDGLPVPIRDLQVFPSAASVTFRLAANALAVSRLAS